jgi:redox-sensitive bicupin YhaK (pirin superfamily)
MIQQSGPVVLAQPSLLAHVILEPRSEIKLLLPPIAELGAYILDGSLRLNGETLEKPEIAILEPLDTAIISNLTTAKAEVLLLGGDRAARPIVYSGPYVYDSQEDAHEAHQRFLRGEMGDLYE